MENKRPLIIALAICFIIAVALSVWQIIESRRTNKLLRDAIDSKPRQPMPPPKVEKTEPEPIETPDSEDTPNQATDPEFRPFTGGEEKPKDVSPDISADKTTATSQYVATARNPKPGTRNKKPGTRNTKK